MSRIFTDYVEKAKKILEDNWSGSSTKPSSSRDARSGNLGGIKDFLTDYLVDSKAKAFIRDNYSGLNFEYLHYDGNLNRRENRGGSWIQQSISEYVL
jgi:hypothetical protein